MGNTCKECIGQEPELGDKLADGLDRAMHPGETTGERIVRKAGEAVNEIKDDIVDGAKKVKDKVEEQF